MFFFFKQKTAYEVRISDWSSDVCSSDLGRTLAPGAHGPQAAREEGELAPHQGRRRLRARRQGPRHSRGAAGIGEDRPGGRGDRGRGAGLVVQARQDRAAEATQEAASQIKASQKGEELGRAECRERGCKYVKNSV